MYRVDFSRHHGPPDVIADTYTFFISNFLTMDSHCDIQNADDGLQQKVQHDGYVFRLNTNCHQKYLIACENIVSVPLRVHIMPHVAI